MKKICLTFVMLLFAITLVGCTKPAVIDNHNEQTIVVTDSREKEVEVKYPAEKIVCLLNSGLNDLYMLGAGDKVIGIDKWTYDTEEIYNITSKIDDRIKDKTLPAVDGNIEKIVGINPDVVIIWAGQKEDIEALENNGIKVIGIQVNKFEDVFWKLRLLSKITGKEDRAEEIIDYTEKEIEKINTSLKEIDETRILKSVFVWGPTKLDFAGNNSTGDSILKAGGLKNTAKDVNEEHFIASMEQVIKWNPEAAIIWSSNDLDPEDYYNDKQWANIDAVKDNRIIELPHPFYCDLWTVKYVYSSKYAVKSMYPEMFKDIDLENEKYSMLEYLYKIDFK